MDIRLKNLLDKMDSDDAIALRLLLENLSDPKLSNVSDGEVERRYSQAKEKIAQIEGKALKRLKEQKENPKCSHCLRGSSEVENMLSSINNRYICSVCIRSFYAQLQRI